MTEPLDLDALAEMEAHLPEMVWRGCVDHPEHNSNPSCWGIYEPEGVGDKLRLLDVGERLVAIRNALPALIAAARRLAELESQLVFLAAQDMLDLPYDGVRMVSDTFEEQLAAILIGIDRQARELGWDPKAKDGG